ncbi:MAG: hypothetical protein LUQ32_06585 [Methanomicrobiales archaeon]|nr:hypothetical protein [Methanomicrobiales archaeon]
MFERPRISYVIMALLFILPQSMYVIGDYMAVGIRFPLFRYQLTFQSISGVGNGTAGTVLVSIITVVRELQYISLGNVGGALGKTALATYIWMAGLVVLFAAAALILSWHLLDNPDHARFPGPLIIITGVLFLIWAVIQYGLLFSGPSGYSIPVGVPILWYCGYQFMQAAKGEGE